MTEEEKQHDNHDMESEYNKELGENSVGLDYDRESDEISPEEFTAMEEKTEIYQQLNVLEEDEEDDDEDENNYEQVELDNQNNTSETMSSLLQTDDLDIQTEQEKVSNSLYTESQSVDNETEQSTTGGLHSLLASSVLRKKLLRKK